MIFAETKRLYLRALDKTDLPALTELIGGWDEARWLANVPYPYRLANAEEFLEQLAEGYSLGRPRFFAMEDKASGGFMGGAGLNPLRMPDAPAGEMVLGYWLGAPYWGKGYMSEAIGAVTGLAFERPEVDTLSATTDPMNTASQNVLRKAGFRYLGVHARAEPCLRGAEKVTHWRLKRQEFERKSA